jgi:hypothetical protein
MHAHTKTHIEMVAKGCYLLHLWHMFDRASNSVYKWWDGALDDATLHLHFVEAILRRTCTWFSQLIIFQDDAALLQRVLGACFGG